LVEALRESVRRARTATTSALDESVAALRDIASGGTEAEGIHVARLLRHAALERKHSAPRVASVALLLSDALTFTSVASLSEEDLQPLRTGLLCLMNAFVSTADERRVLRELIAHQWYVTPGFDPAFAESA
jgi:hypothetical protein